ncbi:unannotated protein [freshwater metagenome]|uniref:Unannotated protein n=1 Tax=freshwater metagenome TaxID=449393 RepID=A0A6J7TQI0_9ZZZZ
MFSSTTLTSAITIGVPHDNNRCSSPLIARSWSRFGNVKTFPPSSVIPKPEYTMGPKRLMAARRTSTGMAAAPYPIPRRDVSL